MYKKILQASQFSWFPVIISKCSWVVNNDTDLTLLIDTDDDIHLHLHVFK